MYRKAVESVQHAIPSILPPPLQNKKDGPVNASIAYESLQKMLADRSFVTEEPKFCYDSAHTLVCNIIGYHANATNAGRSPPNSLPAEHFNLVYDAVRVMCFVVNSVVQSRRMIATHPHLRRVGAVAARSISVGRLYEDLDSLKLRPGLPTDNNLLKNLWAGMAEVIQHSLGVETTQNLLIQKKIISA